MSDVVSKKTLEFAINARKCITIKELGECFQALLAPYGVTASSAWAVIGGDSKIGRGFGEWPAEWARHYADNKYFDVDPIFASLLKGNDAGYWDEQLAGYPLSAEGKKVMEDASQHGYSDGYSRLIPTLNGSYYLVSLYGKRLDRDPYVRAMFDLASTKFVHEGVLLLNRRVGSPIRGFDLTQRQLEVLQLKAAGKTDKEAADALGVSIKAIEGHLTKIRKLLKARSTSQAISIARGKGLIKNSLTTK